MAAKRREPAKKPRRPARKRPVTANGPITVSEKDGVLTAHEQALFCAGHEAFCRRLADAAGRQPDVRSVTVCLASGTCRVEFTAGQVPGGEMAARFAAALREATVLSRVPGLPADHGGWTGLTIFPNGAAPSRWEATEERAGAIRLHSAILERDFALLRRIGRDLAEAPGVTSCRPALWGRDLDIHFDSAVTNPGAIIAAAEERIYRARQPAMHKGEDELAAPPAVATGIRRVGYLALAAGSFALTVVGVLVPGIPTVPFLLATSYFLVRSSPSLNERLLRSRFFGPILTDLETSGGLRRVSKMQLIGVTVAVAVVTLVLINPPAAIVLVVILVVIASIYAVMRLPELSSESQRALPGAAAPAPG